jgi:hypothetical protein
MKSKPEIKIFSTLEFKLSIILSLTTIVVAAIFSQELDYFAAASSEFMLGISFLILIFLIVFFRTVSIAAFRREEYSHSFLPALMMLLSIIIALFFPFSKISIQSEFEKNKERRKIAADKAYFREWPADKNGIVKLPRGYMDLALDSVIRFCDDDGVITTVFITFTQNTRANGLVYVEGLKNENDLEKLVNRKNLFPYYPIKYRKLDENWYSISSDKDFFGELNWGD